MNYCQKLIGKSHSKQACSSGFLFLIFSFLSCYSFLLNAAEHKFLQFDIPKQRADKALIAFAQQTDTSLLFSFELTQKYQTNPLSGYYSFDSALAKLLLGSGLVAQKTNNGQVKIKQRVDIIVNTPSPLPKATPANLPIEKISIVGSRVLGRTANEMPVPVDILTQASLVNTGQTEVGQMLEAIAPSFNFSTSVLSDGTDAIKPASLRGLGPDQTLVLINGKRRHQSSLIHINSSVGRGTAGTDLNAIPAASIKRIEVLRDGSSAQYGSDAIAGVINIILNDDDSEGKFSGSFGKYSEGDGATTDINFSKGFSLNQQGFVNITANYHQQEPTNRAGLQGNCLYNTCTIVSESKWLTDDPREISANRNTFRIGDSEINQFSLVVNSEYELSYGELYSFITYSSKNNESAAFFRENKNMYSNPILQDGDAVIPAGYLPKIQSDINDISYNLGYHLDLTDNDNLDISYTYGRNTMQYKVNDTVNASYVNSLRVNSGYTANEIRQQIPRSADAFDSALSLQTLNLSYQKYFDLVTFSFGGELRRDIYQLNSGDEYSYKDYDTINGVNIAQTNHDSGTQGFNGLPHEYQVDETRNVYSFYVEGETDLVDDVLINAALRYDNYQGFGGTLNYKLAGKWAITDTIAVRGSFSTGFRAPSMQQLHFNNFSTQYLNFNERYVPMQTRAYYQNSPDEEFISGQQIPVKVATIQNGSVESAALGITELNEERSKNSSLGLVYHPLDNLNISFDYYRIDIQDRIVLSNSIGIDASEQINSVLANNTAAAVQFFLNGLDSKTSGVDFITTWQQALFSGDLTLTFASNYTKTEVVGLFTPPESALIKLPVSAVFSDKDISIISQWQPRLRTNLSALYQQEKWTANLTFNHYGEYTIIDGGKQTYGDELITDVRINYQLTPALSFSLGANNLFDIYPDKNKIGNAGAGTIVDKDNNLIVQSDGVFAYSRRYSPFGFNGAYYYAGAQFSF